MSRSPDTTRPDPLHASARDDEPSSTGSVPSAGPVRVARAGVLGGLSLLLATGAHLLGVQQLALHELFSLAGAAQACTVQVTGGPSAARTGHLGHGVGHLVSTCASSGGMQMSSSVPGWVMWAAHLAAVLATAWLLAHGEAWLWRAVDRVAAAAGLTSGRPASPAPTDQKLTGYVDAVCRRLAHAAAAPRGPPLLLA